jgi:bisanhydrobacterioruberin hydratase
MKKNRVVIAVFLMLFFNVTGSIALFIPALETTVLTLTPFNLLVTFFIFYWANNDFSINLIRTVIVVFFIGLFIEILGVNFKVIFGEYTYGETLGFKILNTPIIIGLNWLSLSLGCFGIASYVFKPKYLVVLGASFLMVFVDYIIEPIAMELDFWDWKDDTVPVQNYVSWFLVSIIIQFIIFQSKVRLNFKICFALLFSQVLFMLIQYFKF